MDTRWDIIIDLLKGMFSSTFFQIIGFGLATLFCGWIYFEKLPETLKKRKKQRNVDS